MYASDGTISLNIHLTCKKIAKERNEPFSSQCIEDEIETQGDKVETQGDKVETQGDKVETQGDKVKTQEMW